MPYIISHTSFALSLGETLPCFSDGESRALFLLGSLGPDVYFFDRIPPTPFIPNQKKHGNRLHDAPCDALARAFLAHSDAALLPYVYGFLTHIALDSTLHPYICALHSGLDHTRFEGDIDAIVYERYRSRYDFRHLFSRPKQLDALDKLVTDVSQSTVQAGKRGAYARSVRKMLRIYPVLLDPKGRRFRFVAAFERLVRKKGAVTGFLLAAPRSYFPGCMNEAHAPWYAKPFPKTERTESVDELFLEARALAEKLITAAQNGDAEAVSALLTRRTMSDGPIP